MNDNKDHLRALLAAYNEVTGFDLPFIRAREHALRNLDKLGLTPDDVRAVMRELKRLVASDPRHYPESCLDFRNAIVDTEKFDGRARRLRARTARKKNRDAAPVPMASREKAPASHDEEARLRAAVKAQAEEFKRSMAR